MSHQNGNGHTNGLRERPNLAQPDRLPPQNLSVERGLLGIILLEGRPVLDDIATLLRPDDFYRDTHRVAYREILALYADGKPVDVLTVAERLEKTAEWPHIGDEFLGEV